MASMGTRWIERLCRCCPSMMIEMEEEEVEEDCGGGGGGGGGEVGWRKKWRRVMLATRRRWTKMSLTTMIYDRSWLMVAWVPSMSTINECIDIAANAAAVAVATAAAATAANAVC